MDRSVRHFILYAKHHYEETETISDLKTIMGERCGMEAKYIRIGDINHLLLRTVYPLIATRGNPELAFMEFAAHVEEDSITNACLAFLKLTEVRHFDFDLGEADPTILPLTKKSR